METTGYPTQLLSRGDAPAEPVQQPAFAELANEIAIARGASDAALDILRKTCARLGIVNMFGCAISADTEPDKPRGQIEETRRSAQALTEVTREIRGLAETLEQRL